MFVEVLSAPVGSYTAISTTNGRCLWLGVKVLKLCFSGSLPNFNLIAGYSIIADGPAPGKYGERDQIYGFCNMFQGYYATGSSPLFSSPG